LFGVSQFLILDDNELVLRDLITSGFVEPVDHLTGHCVHELLFQTMAGVPVYLPEADTFGGRDRWEKRYRTGNKREL